MGSASGGEMVAQNRFKAFLRSRQGDDALYRQFVGDALANSELPDPTSWEELRDHIIRRNPGASPDTLEAAEDVWQRYVESTREPQEE